MNEKDENIFLSVKQDVANIKNWPTDTLCIDYYDKSQKLIEPHTILLFIPGNPGCIGWYATLLKSIVEKLGIGFSARGVSYAGHGVGESIVNPSYNTNDDESISEKKRIAWTIDGQVEHKLQWIDQFQFLYNKSNNIQPKLITIGHSIGCHLLQRICILRKDILDRVQHSIFLMPFTIFDPPLYSQKVYLNTGARTEKLALSILDGATNLAKALPRKFLNFCLEKFAGVDDENGRELSLNLITSPAMGRNFLTLGMEELRDVPQIPDEFALRLIANKSYLTILFCGTDVTPDQWAPAKHIALLKELQQNRKIPKSIDFVHLETLLHDFVVHPEMLPPVIDLCVSTVSNSKRNSTFLKSRL